MKPRPERPDDAARWIVRRDRGLSAAESIEFELWLAADERHAAALRRSEGAWSRLDRIPERVAAPVLAASTCRRSFWRRARVVGSLAAAAAVGMIAVRFWSRSAPIAEADSLVAAGPRAVTLADGSLVRLNAGSQIAEQFTATERRVRLTRGEAHFTVTKNPERPFVVSAGALRVRALGTAFNVNVGLAQIEVLVTEGRVGLERTAPNALGAQASPPLHLAANERAVAPLAAPSADPAAPDIVVTRLSAAEMARALVWQDSLLRLGGATLAEIAAEFELRSGHPVRISDLALAQLRVGGRFRADDVDGFAELLATTFGIEVERADDGALVLRKKTSVSR